MRSTKKMSMIEVNGEGMCYEEEVQPYRKTDYKPIIYISGLIIINGILPYNNIYNYQIIMFIRVVLLININTN